MQSVLMAALATEEMVALGLPTALTEPPQRERLEAAVVPTTALPGPAGQVAAATAQRMAPMDRTAKPIRAAVAVVVPTTESLERLEPVVPAS